MIYLSIGSNLSSEYGNKFHNIYKTIDFLNNEKIKVLIKSSFFLTPSYPNKKNPTFVNIAVKVKYLLSPESLIKKIFLIETKMKRIRTGKNQPRTCDIDIIDFKGLIKEGKKLTLPHLNAHKRNFVLYPLLEICPNWIHPITSESIDILIKKLNFNERNEITKIKESDILL